MISVSDILGQSVNSVNGKQGNVVLNASDVGSVDLYGLYTESLSSTIFTPKVLAVYKYIAKSNDVITFSGFSSGSVKFDLDLVIGEGITNVSFGSSSQPIHWEGNQTPDFSEAKTYKLEFSCCDGVWSGRLHPDMSEYAKLLWIEQQGFVRTGQGLSGLATELWVNQSLSAYQPKIDSDHKLDYALLENVPPAMSLSGYATELWVNQQGYLTEHQSLSGYQPKIDSEHKLDYAMLYNAPVSLSAFTEDSNHQLVTATEKSTWNNKITEPSGKAANKVLGTDENGNIVWKDGGGSATISVGNCSNIRCYKVPGSTSVKLKWKDPSDVESDGVVVAAWKQTTVVRKVGSYPTDKSDGTVVVTSSVRDQYVSTAFIDTVPDSSTTYYYGFFPETEDGVVTLSDGTSNRIMTRDVDLDFATLKDMTRSGELQSILEEGTSFVVNHSVYGDLEVQIVGYNGVLPKALRYVASDNSTVYLDGLSREVGSTVYSDENLTTALSGTVSAISGEFVIGNHDTNGHEIVPNEITYNSKVYTCKAYSTVLWSRYLLPVSNGSETRLAVQFDAKELEYAQTEDETYQASKTYYTLSGESTYNEFTSYNVGDAITGTLYEKNHANRVSYGYNRWSQSGIRQFLNADSSSNWWTKQNIFDVKPNIATSAGFLNGLDSDFKSCLGKVLNKTAKNTVTDGGGFEYTSDLIFLPSRSEVFNGSLNSGYDGSQFEYCKTLTDDTRKKCTQASSESSSPIYYYYWLRSPYVGHAYHVYTVTSSGGSDYVNASGSDGVAFACAII